MFMRKLKTLTFIQISYIKKPLVWLYKRFILIIAIILSDKTYLKWRYKMLLGRTLNIDKPVLFQEKLQWLKLHDRKSIYHQMVDKYEAKQFIASKIGEKYVIPTIGIYNCVEEIDTSLLPDQFVLKGTFDSGSYYICRDKSQIDVKKMKERLTVNWNYDYYILGKEWPYKGLKRRILAEPLLKDGNSEYVRDCKVFCFNGEPKFLYLSHDISAEAKTDFYDLEWNKLDMRMKDPNSDVIVAKPRQINDIIECSRKLSEGTPFLRVDFYLCEDDFYCGELTFYHCGGFQDVYPTSWNRILGDWIDLPEISSKA